VTLAVIAVAFVSPDAAGLIADIGTVLGVPPVDPAGAIPDIAALLDQPGLVGDLKYPVIGLLGGAALARAEEKVNWPLKS